MPSETAYKLGRLLLLSNSYLHYGKVDVDAPTNVQKCKLGILMALDFFGWACLILLVALLLPFMAVIVILLIIVFVIVVILVIILVVLVIVVVFILIWALLLVYVVLNIATLGLINIIWIPCVCCLGFMEEALKA